MKSRREFFEAAQLLMGIFDNLPIFMVSGVLNPKEPWQGIWIKYPNPGELAGKRRINGLPGLPKKALCATTAALASPQMSAWRKFKRYLEVSR